MDSIFLKDIEVWTHIGVPDAERKKAQKLRISIEFYTSLQPVSSSDDVSHGIDYKAVTEAVVALGLTERNTLERFAEDVATMVVSAFKPEGGVKVSVAKIPDLPLSEATITITRP